MNAKKEDEEDCMNACSRVLAHMHVQPERREKQEQANKFQRQEVTHKLLLCVTICFVSSFNAFRRKHTNSNNTVHTQPT